MLRANPEHPLLCRGKGEPSHILAADTIVVFDDKIIGKPKSREEAFQTLSMLLQNPHHVITGVCQVDLQTGSKTCFYDTSTVLLADYSDEELQLTSIRGNHMIRPAAMPSRNIREIRGSSKATGITS